MNDNKGNNVPESDIEDFARGFNCTPETIKNLIRDGTIRRIYVPGPNKENLEDEKQVIID